MKLDEFVNLNVKTKILDLRFDIIVAQHETTFFFMAFLVSGVSPGVFSTQAGQL